MESLIFLVVRLLNFIHRTSYGSIMKCLELRVYVVCMIWISFVLCSLSWYFNLFLAYFSSSFFHSLKRRKMKLEKEKENSWKIKFMTKEGARERADDKTKGKEDETLCFSAPPQFFFLLRPEKWLWRILKMAEKFVFLSPVPSKTPWQFMFAFGSIDIKGICHLNNKSHAALFGWGREKIWCRINWGKCKMKVDVMRTFLDVKKLKNKRRKVIRDEDENMTDVDDVTRDFHD